MQIEDSIWEFAVGDFTLLERKPFLFSVTLIRSHLFENIDIISYIPVLCEFGINDALDINSFRCYLLACAFKYIIHSNICPLRRILFLCSLILLEFHKRSRQYVPFVLAYSFSPPHYFLSKEHLED
jgi:hypothetical protein